MATAKGEVFMGFQYENCYVGAEGVKSLWGSNMKIVI